MTQTITLKFAEEASLAKIRTGVTELRDFFRDEALPVTVSEGSMQEGHPVVRLDIGQPTPKEGWRAKLSLPKESVTLRVIDAFLTLYKDMGTPVKEYIM